MKRTTLDYSRILAACGLEGRRIYSGHASILEKSFTEVHAAFANRFVLVSRHIRIEPLSSYRCERKILAELWTLASNPKPVKDSLYLSHTDPAKAGVLCEIDNEQLLITADNVPCFDLPFTQECREQLSTLRFEIDCWKKGLCAIWAAMIASRFIQIMQNDAVAFLKEPLFFDEVAPHLHVDDRIGAPLELTGIGLDTAREFYSKCQNAEFGSLSCESDLGVTLKNWLRTSTIGTLRDMGLSLDQAHLVLLTGSQRDPSIDVELRWNMDLGTYQFVPFVRNLRHDGYVDANMSSEIPAPIIAHCFKDASSKAQSNFVRLMLRAIKNKLHALVSPITMDDY